MVNTLLRRTGKMVKVVKNQIYGKEMKINITKEKLDQKSQNVARLNKIQEIVQQNLSFKNLNLHTHTHTT